MRFRKPFWGGGGNPLKRREIPREHWGFSMVEVYRPLPLFTAAHRRIPVRDPVRFFRSDPIVLPQLSHWDFTSRTDAVGLLRLVATDEEQEAQRKNECPPGTS